MTGKTRLLLCVMLASAGYSGADSIIVHEKTYTGVKIVESASRYYFRLPDGTSISASKSDIGPDQIRFGDDPLPSEMPASANPAPAALFDKTPAALPTTQGLPPSPIQAGAACVKVSSSSDPMETLEVNAIVLRNETTSLAFCSMDAAAVDRPLLERVLALLAEQGSTLRPGSVFLSPTGVHTGRYRGILKGFWKESLWGVFDEAMLEQAAAHAAEAIRQAEKNVQAALLRIAETEMPQAHAPRQGGSATADSTLSVFVAESAAGAPLAYFLNFAMCPPPATGQTPVARRGLPGALAMALREKTGKDVPVLFVNGAAGDIEPLLTAGESALGAQLAQAALAALESEAPRDNAAMAFAARTAVLPPPLLAGAAPTSALLQFARIGETVFLAMPGAPAAQIGLLLRVKALTQNADHVFLLGQTGDALGFQPGIEEFFAVTDSAQASLYGPLGVLWYGENYLPETAAQSPEPVWANVPALDRFASAFAAALERGHREAAPIGNAWNDLLKTLDSSRAGLRALTGELPPEFQALADRVPPDQTGLVMAQAAAVRFRREFAAFSEEQRAILMGVAQGANIPFDAILMLQLFAAKETAPEPIRKAMDALKALGYDFLARPAAPGA